MDETTARVLEAALVKAAEPAPELPGHEPEKEVFAEHGLAMAPVLTVICNHCKFIIRALNPQVIESYLRGNKVTAPCEKCNKPVTVQKQHVVLAGSSALPNMLPNRAARRSLLHKR